VDITNLNRQFIHYENDIGREKTRSAKEKLEWYNPEIQINAITTSLDQKNVHAHLSGQDLVLSCVDNQQTRYLLNNACVHSNIPLIDGGISGFEGYVLTVLPGITPCYQCIFPQPNTRSGGVIGATAGVLGSMMAMEAIKYIVGIPIRSHFYYVDLLFNRITPIQAKRNSDCPICSTRS